jgi:hypothetical protein
MIVRLIRRLFGRAPAPVDAPVEEDAPYVPSELELILRTALRAARDRELVDQEMAEAFADVVNVHAM